MSDGCRRVPTAAAHRNQPSAARGPPAALHAPPPRSETDESPRKRSQPPSLAYGVLRFFVWERERCGRLTRVSGATGVTLVIPAWNEAEAIGAVLDEVPAGIADEVIVVIS